MATNRSEAAKKVTLLVFNFYGWNKISKSNQQNEPGTSPLPVGMVEGTVSISTTSTTNLQQQHSKRNDRKECHILWPSVRPGHPR